MKPADIIARLKFALKIRTGRLMDGQGNQYWYFHWKQHRDDGLPAFEGVNGTKKWYKYGDLHRDGDKAAIEWSDGGRDYYKLGLLHRDNNLPAILRANGDKEYYVNGELHRLDGPAKDLANGIKEFWHDGKPWKEGVKAVEKVREEIRVKQEFEVAVKEANATENNIQNLKDVKNKKPPPSLKPQ